MILNIDFHDPTVTLDEWKYREQWVPEQFERTPTQERLWTCGPELPISVVGTIAQVRAAEVIRVADRAQTTHDYAVGIGVFLLTVAFVFSYVPTALGTIDSGGTGSDSAIADRLSTEIVANLSVDGYPNRLNNSSVSTFFNDSSMSTIRTEYELRNSTLANVTLEYANGTAIAGRDVHAGAQYADQRAATMTRLVVIDDGRYRLVVRVW